MGSLPSLPGKLEDLVSTKTKAVYREDGFDVVEVPWYPPKLNDAERKEAEDAYKVMAASLEPASDSLKQKWLATLGSLVAGNMPAIEAQARLKAFSVVWDVPACLLTKEALRASASRFKWFPSFAELDGFMKELEKPMRTREKRLRIMAYGSEHASADKRVRALMGGVK